MSHLLGGTVGELKHRMSSAEFTRHLTYFQKHGRLTPRRMFDRGPALLAFKIDQAVGHKSKPEDYLPQFSGEEAEASVEDVIKAFGVTKRVK